MEQRAVALRPKQVSEQDIAEMTTAEIVLIQGDLSVLTAEQRVEYYAKVCQSIGLNPLTKPFDYITLNGKLTLYAKKDATDQLRNIHGISVTRLEREQTTDTYDVTAYGRVLATGREDSSLGSVPITNLRGEALSNAKMKAETKAKRRLTLSLAGLGWLDETEVASVPSAEVVTVTEQGEIVHPPRPKTLVEAVAAPPAPVPVEEAERPEAPPPPPEAKEDTTEPLPGKEDAPVVEAPAAPGVDSKAFIAWMKETFVPSALVSKTARAMFGDDVESVKALTDEQRASLKAALTERLDEARQ